jgi:hypothetical protein
MYPKPNEWNLLKQQFDALADKESANADTENAASTDQG